MTQSDNDSIPSTNTTSRGNGGHGGRRSGGGSGGPPAPPFPDGDAPEAGTLDSIMWGMAAIAYIIWFLSQLHDILAAIAREQREAQLRRPPSPSDTLISAVSQLSIGGLPASLAGSSAASVPPSYTSGIGPRPIQATAGITAEHAAGTIPQAAPSYHHYPLNIPRFHDAPPRVAEGADAPDAQQPPVPPPALAPATRWYMVSKGFHTGLSTNWDWVSAQVNGVSGARFRRYGTRVEAQAAWEQALASGLVEDVLPDPAPPVTEPGEGEELILTTEEYNFVHNHRDDDYTEGGASGSGSSRVV